MNRAVVRQRAVVQQHLHRLLHEEGITAGALDYEALESLDAVLHPHPAGDLKVPGRPLPACAWRLRRRRGRGTQKSGEHLFGALLAERVETQLRVICLATPLMRI